MLEQELMLRNDRLRLHLYTKCLAASTERVDIVPVLLAAEDADSFGS
jgi:hypothetical protein